MTRWKRAGKARTHDLGRALLQGRNEFIRLIRITNRLWLVWDLNEPAAVLTSDVLGTGREETAA